MRVRAPAPALPSDGLDHIQLKSFPMSSLLAPVVRIGPTKWTPILNSNVAVYQHTRSASASHLQLICFPDSTFQCHLLLVHTSVPTLLFSVKYLWASLAQGGVTVTHILLPPP